MSTAQENDDDVDNPRIDVTKTDQALYSPLYLLHPTQYIPTWTLSKKIAKTYGPSYLHKLTMPSIELPNEKDFDKLVENFIKQKEFKKQSLQNIEFIERNLDSKIMSKYVKKLSSPWDSHKREYHEKNKLRPDEIKIGKRKRQLGNGSPYTSTREDFIPREYEFFDIDLCYQLKQKGDKMLPKKFKDEVFRQFVTNINKNGSMAPWQKNYAFSSLPKAFGGDRGEYLRHIFDSMKPQDKKIVYRLKKFNAIPQNKRRKGMTSFLQGNSIDDVL